MESTQIFLDFQHVKSDNIFVGKNMLNSVLYIGTYESLVISQILTQK